MENLLKMNVPPIFGDGTVTGDGGGPDELDDFMSRLSYSYPTETDLGEQPIMSPLSSHSGSDQEFHGFPSVTGSSSGTSFDGCFDDATGMHIAPKSEMEEDLGMLDMLISSDQPLSSAASDSGLSSDHLDLDPNTEYDVLSPALSSPGPSISERGGQNSPSHYANSIEMQQPASFLAQSAPTLSHAPVAVQSLTSKKITPVQIQTVPQGQAGIPTRTITLTKPQSNKPAVNVAPLQQATTASSAKLQQPLVGVKTVLSNGGGTKKLLQNGSAPVGQQLVGGTGKEFRIIRMATMKNGQTVAVTNGLTPVSSTATAAMPNKKITLQVKNGTSTAGATVGSKGTTGTVLSKNVVVTSAGASTGSSNVSGVRKIIRMQQQTNQNGRSILLPLSIQDLRSIKIVNTNNMKSKPANIKLAAASLLQRSKQGLVQGNIVLTKEQLFAEGDGGLSDAAPSSSSDSESYVFDDIIQQSNSMIAEAERQQKHIISDSDVEPDGDDIADDDDDDAEMDEIGKGRNRNGTYQKLVLTNEEKRLLAKEGISLPTSYPLTKHEERELKRIRRKIRNKISAQDSRKRKKEYVDGLEERVKQCTEENQNLVKRIKILQSQNHDLISQMKRIQSLLTKGTSKTTQPATCLMVLLISMALVAVPNLKLGNTTTQQNIQDSIEMSELMQEPANDKLQVTAAAAATQSNRRSLLFDTKESADEELNFEEIMSSFNANSLIANEHDYFTEMAHEQQPLAKRPKLATPTLIEYDVDDELWNAGSNARIKQEPASNGGHCVDAAELFQQKFREFQDVLHRSTLEEGLSADASIKADSAKSPTSELIVDRDLLDLVATKNNGLLELNMDTYSNVLGASDYMVPSGINLLVSGAVSPSVNGADSEGGPDGSDVPKLNASQQIQQQQNNKRKLLL
uniref:Putative creb/atf family transcription factor n=1 Tax=Anopheles triannulatus TaxID=58253 RepID=A0A2M4A029_9DIPT